MMSRITRQRILDAIRQQYKQPERRIHQPVVEPKINPEALKAFREGRFKRTA